jgi:hypothetical protein
LISGPDKGFPLYRGFYLLFYRFTTETQRTRKYKENELNFLYPFSVLKNHGIKQPPRVVIPAEAGIRFLLFVLDSRFHGNDGINQTAEPSFSET